MSGNLPIFTNTPLQGKYKIAIIFTSWNFQFSTRLVEGADEIFSEFKELEISKYQVPGAVELVYAAAQLAKTYDVIIVFGTVIKGETPHFEYVCENVNHGISYLNATQKTPIIFGILTILNKKQAIDRLGGQHGHKGKEAAHTALQMLNFKEKIKI